MTSTPLTNGTANAEYLRELARDPKLAAALREARREAFAILDKHTTQLVGILSQTAETPAIASANQLTDVRRLTIASRQTAAEVKSRRSYAHDILVAGIFNMDNPNWNLTDASSYQTESSNIIVQLMQLPEL